jgi:hypothetical protein
VVACSTSQSDIRPLGHRALPLDPQGTGVSVIRAGKRVHKENRKLYCGRGVANGLGKGSSISGNERIYILPEGFTSYRKQGPKKIGICDID